MATLLYLGFAALGAFVGWQAKAAQVERDESRHEEERDRAWDAAYGIGNAGLAAPPVAAGFPPGPQQGGQHPHDGGSGLTV